MDDKMTITTPLTMGDLRKVCKYYNKRYCMTGANFGEACSDGSCPIIKHRATNILKQKPYERKPRLKMTDDGNKA